MKNMKYADWFRMVALAPLALTALVLTAPPAQAAERTTPVPVSEQVSPVVAPESRSNHRQEWDCGNGAVMVGIVGSQKLLSLQSLGTLCRKIGADGKLAKGVIRTGVKGKPQKPFKNGTARCRGSKVMVGVDMLATNSQITTLIIYCQGWNAAERTVKNRPAVKAGGVGSTSNGTSDLFQFRCSGKQHVMKAFRAASAHGRSDLPESFGKFTAVCDVYNR